MRRSWWTIVGSLAWFMLAPGTLVGWLPFWITRWRVQAPLLGTPGRVVGAAFIVTGFASLVESFARFALVGLGTPAPIASPTRLVVSGQYRHVRNPMYVAILAMLVGQSVVFGSIQLLRYAAVVWAILHIWVLFYEEPRLSAEFGASYDAYRRNVRRWWPRLRPWT
jgi:protein-S-isoprenylcysteine O-methyltransferase Ste14